MDGRVPAAVPIVVTFPIAEPTNDGSVPEPIPEATTIPSASAVRAGITARWDTYIKKQFGRFFAAARKGDWAALSEAKPGVRDILARTLQELPKEGFERLGIL